ncbi:hypothetical protein [Bradyrhizobium guangzhouense]|uniref:hypothetical protein n=1 Tax=Bradyrhizobium guangzhouense TaxID=1325095 RepID=UPI001009B5DA|nr:hypothetical protein [Bradyrhizobium guangzhouense]
MADQEHGSRSSLAWDKAGPISSSSLRGVRNKYLGRRALRKAQQRRITRQHVFRHCGRSGLSAEALAKAEAIQKIFARRRHWIASSQECKIAPQFCHGLLAMTVGKQRCTI